MLKGDRYDNFRPSSPVHASADATKMPNRTERLCTAFLRCRKKCEVRSNETILQATMPPSAAKAIEDGFPSGEPTESATRCRHTYFADAVGKYVSGSHALQKQCPYPRPVPVLSLSKRARLLTFGAVNLSESARRNNYYGT